MTAHAGSAALQRNAGPIIPLLSVPPVPVCSTINGITTRDCHSRRGTMEVNGIAHIFLTASNYERSREFYRELLLFSRF